MSGRALHHDIRSGGPWPPKSETAPPGARRSSLNHATRAADGTTSEPSTSTTCCRRRGCPYRRRPAGSGSRRHGPGPQRPQNRHTCVVATTRPNPPLAPIRPRGGRPDARWRVPANSPGHSRSACGLRHATCPCFDHVHLRSGRHPSACTSFSCAVRPRCHRGSRRSQIQPQLDFTPHGHAGGRTLRSGRTTTATLSGRICL